MRIALLSYRSKTHCGGQGVYVRHLSRGLAELGHEVEVFSGQPYPEHLDPRVRLTEVPSLDLYREPDPFRTPRPSELRDRIDVLELATMWTAGFPEPRTFSLRAARLLRARAGDFDVVHDNQCLGSGLLDIGRRLPLVATVHHPITRDRTLDLAAARWWRTPFVHRWYGFLGMQQRVARQIPELITVSSSSAADIRDDFGVAAGQLRVVPLGVDTALFRPRPRLRAPGRIVAVASADKPLKGIAHLLRAVARLRGTHEIDLRLVAKLEPDGPTEKLIAELGLSDVVTVVAGLSDTELAFLLSSAEIACIPSMYEGFSLPAVEAMASGAALVASRAGALPEVVGDCGVLVEPGNVGELAAAIGALLDDPQRTARLGVAGRRRALSVFSWESVAAQTVSVYEEAIERHTGQPFAPPHETAGSGDADHTPAGGTGRTSAEEAQAC
ncbi:glycosyltransferase family 4 protein [Nocardia sp. alder85J]|uniref:glycosyltransferase family 4 protein n=1 Tax=Nocardia sp. alder85J TaxID=2862949 RepID=UPI001CD25B84|nr:glycosyltransferase family 4 protein [Nocardia sp. alder85J]MCX4093695.1 glycosyltransferase family 4 protein [Nocardia sp. alder85J]